MARANAIFQTGPRRRRILFRRAAVPAGGGRSRPVRMSYNGHVIDLTPFIGQKVARLTLE
jgi:hypothetical protein